MTYTLSWAGLIALAIQFVLPVLVGLVTKSSTPGGVKAVLLLFLSAVTQFLVSLTQGFDLKTAAWATLVGFAFSVAMHFGLWKPTDVADRAADTLNHD